MKGYLSIREASYKWGISVLLQFAQRNFSLLPKQ